MLGCMQKPASRRPKQSLSRAPSEYWTGAHTTHEYWTGAHTTHRLRYHLFWIPKYRRRVLVGPVALRLRELFEQACEVQDWQLHELTIQTDHVHLLVQAHPSQSVSSIVQRFKGGTSRVLRAEFPALEEFLWGKQFWADGYFVESVGQVEESVIRQYIRDQQSVRDQRPA